MIHPSVILVAFVAVCLFLIGKSFVKMFNQKTFKNGFKRLDNIIDLSSDC